MTSTTNQQGTHKIVSSQARLHAPGGNYKNSEVPITDALSTNPLGVIDSFSLCFVEAGKSLELQDLIPNAIQLEEKIIIRNLRTIGSFNWLSVNKGEKPTILVPGSPPTWKNQQMPFTLKPDVEVFGPGTFANTHGSAVSEEDSLLAVFATVDVLADEQSPFSWSSVDFIFRRDTLRHLLRWASLSRSLADFRVDFELLGEQTIIAKHWRPGSETMMLPGSFGFSYEKDQTIPAPGCEGSSGAGHNRVVSYDFGGLHLVVRFEADACLPDSFAGNEYPKRNVLDTENSKNNYQDAESSHSTSSSINVRRAGIITPHDRLVELKTRSEKGATKYSWTETYPQMFFGQVEHHILAVHSRGAFFRYRHDRMNSSMPLRRAGAEAQTGLKRLHIVLEIIQNLVITRGKGNGISVVQRNGLLEVFETVSKIHIPSEVEAHFASESRDSTSSIIEKV